MSRFAEDLSLAVRTRHPLVYVVTPEEERAEAAIAQVADSLNPSRQVLYYDIIGGFSSNTPDTTDIAPGYAKHNLTQALQFVEREIGRSPTLYVFRDLHRRLSVPRLDELVLRQLRNLARLLRTSRHTLILLSPLLELPPELEEQAIVLDFPLPDEDDIRRAIAQIVPVHQIQLTPYGLDQLVKACAGLTRDRIAHALAKSLLRKQAITESDIDLILAEKRQRIRQTEYLEFFAPQETLNRIGGLHALKEWLLQRQRAFSDEARRFGLPYPKGVLLLGIQGTGKSLCAKAIAHLWRLPLLRLDVGRLFGSLVGQSESRTRQTIQLAEALAPCVLWLDEIDKAFAGLGSTSTDSGTSQRVLGALLTWMQEKSSPTFIVATANSLYTLPPELLRKGRFDEIFFINLPDREERKEIFAVHLQRFRPADLQRFDLDALADLSPDFSGAEIEQAIVEGMYRAFNSDRDLEMADILHALQHTVPLASTAREAIAAMQAWASQGRARLASGAIAPPDRERPPAI